MQRLNLYTITVCLLFSSALLAEEEKKADENPVEKITFADHVLPIFRARCGSCHNSNDRKGGLAVDQYALMMEGGSSGTVIEPGDSALSYLFMLVNHEDTPKMPPNADKIPEAELVTIKKWIDLGALENSGSTANIKKKASLAKIEVSGARPAEVAVPAQYLGDPAVVPNSLNAVTALATSPWAPLTAVSGFKQVAIYNTNSMELLGVLAYPEGQPEIMQFSRTGDLLMVGGGRGGAEGKVVVFDVKTGERKAVVGAEYDSILGADISPDQTLVALGGPKKMIRTYTTDGELVYENKKHTDWVMSAGFSPDGVLMVSGDRAGGLIVWEAETGRLFYDLIGHKDSINSVSWRPDSNVLASGSKDGTIKLWEMNNGKEIKSWNAHGGGVTSIEYTRDGNIVSTGIDKVTRLWNGDGGKIRDFPAFTDIGMEVTYDDESKRVIAGDWTGVLQVWNGETGEVVGSINTNPPTVAVQIQSLDQQIAAVGADVTNKTNAVTGLKQKITDRQLLATNAKAAFDNSVNALNQMKAAKVAADTLVNEKNALLTTANNAFTQADTAYKAAETAASLLTVKVQEAKTAVDAAQALVNQATAEEKSVVDKVAALKIAADEALAKAAVTEEEQKVIETDEAVKQAVAERVAASEKAKAEFDVASQTIAPAIAKREQVTKELEGKLVAHQAVTTELAAAVNVTAQAKPVLDTAITTLAATQEAVKQAQAAQTQAVQAEKVAQDASNVAKQTADQTAAAAIATPEEMKAITDADAALKTASDQLARLQDHLKRLQATQSQLATAAKSE